MDIKEGLQAFEEVIVEKNNTALSYGSGTLEVFATPALCALMEKTSLKAVNPFIEEGYSTVGIDIKIKHMKASPLNAHIKCKSELYKVEGKKLFFSLEAFDEKGKIGEGTHIRYIVNIKDFLEKANK